jgi:hypothetical protein
MIFQGKVFDFRMRTHGHEKVKMQGMNDYDKLVAITISKMD